VPKKTRPIVIIGRVFFIPLMLHLTLKRHSVVPFPKSISAKNCILERSFNQGFAIGMQNPPQQLTQQIAKQFVGQG
jgi:hypothetical protein